MPLIEPTRYADGHPMLLAGLRRVHAYAESAEGIPAQWREFAALGALPGQVAGVAYGAMCANMVESQRFEYMCAMEVAGFDALPPSLGRMRVPAQRYAVFTHHGHVSTLRATWGAIWGDWLPRSGERPADTPDFERYDERFDAATGSGVVEIWFPVQPTGDG